MRILIVDDHNLFREGLAGLLAGQQDMTVVGQASCVKDAVAMAAELKPDVILMDFTMPDGTGLDATKAILLNQPSAKILFLTVHEDDELLFEALRRGAIGYLLKNVSAAQLLKMVRSIEQGEAALMPGMTLKIVNEFARRSGAHAPAQPALDHLSARELEVLEELRKGATNREIATRLFISENTVRNHVHSILAKLKLQSRSQLVNRSY